MAARSESELDRLFRDAAIAMLVTDLDGRVLQANNAFATLLGYGIHQLTGLPVAQITYPGDVVISRAVLTGGLPKGANSWVFEKRYVRSSGAAVWVRNSCSFLHDDTGSPVRIVVFSENITAHRALEQTLRRSEWRFRSIVEGLPVAVAILDRSGKISYESPFIEALLGYAPEERVGRMASEFIHPDDRHSVESSWRSSLAAHYDATVAAEARSLHKDGSWRTVEVVGRNLMHNPVISGILVLAWDVTQRAAARKQVLEYASATERRYFELLKRLSRETPERNTLLAAMDDTRPALMGIAGLLDVLLGTKLTATQLECVGRMQDSVGTLLKTGDSLAEINRDRPPQPS